MKIILFGVLVFLHHVFCGNILIISPLPSGSHYIWNKALSMGLVEKGHNVTILGYNKEEKVHPNFTSITMEGIYDNLGEVFKMEESVDVSALELISELYVLSEYACEHDFKTNGLQTLLNYPKDFKFDLIIYDLTLCQCFYPLVEIFHNPPVIAITAFLLPPYLSDAFGNHLHPSYLPFYGTKYNSDMSFGQRVLNFIFTYADALIRSYIARPKELKLAKGRFGENIRPLEEVERNITLLLANTDPVLNSPIALPPNIIPVGGLHTKPAKPLPEDIEAIITKAKDGVILFAMGTNLKSSEFRPEVKQAFLQAFSKLPQTILWKYETDDLENVPKNVILKKWLPQGDILGHRKTRLFLSHGGTLSTQEAMYHGVPVIGFPFFADQHINIHQMKEKGFAEYVDLQKNITSDQLLELVQKVLNSKRYKDKINDISKLYRDQPQTAMERAVFWIEYVMRHGTAEHLVLPARDMPYYKTTGLDVFAAFALFLVVVYCLGKIIVKYLCKAVTRTNRKIKQS